MAVDAMPREPLVTTPHPAATKAGMDVLEAGGTAIEAAVAAGAVLAVVLPHFNGLGGDAVWLLADAGGWHAALMGIGQAARHLPDDPADISTRGPMSALTTACLVDSWDMALRLSASRWGGKRSFAELVEPAFRLARDGFTPSPSQRFWLDFRAGEWPSWPRFADHFAVERRLRQPALAAVLGLLMEDGPRSFYEGRVADRLSDGFRKADIALTKDDLRATRAWFEAPLSQRFGPYELLAPPAPTQGMTTLAIMSILERVGIADAEEDGADFYHLAVEAVKRAFLHRGAIADPRSAPGVAERLLSEKTLAAAAARIDRARALPWDAPFAHGDTVYLAAHDAWGRCASLLQSTYYDWGSGVVVGDTGILWQNRAAAFDRAPGRAGSPQPGALPFYTLNPGIAVQDGRPALLYGTQGADGQPQTLALLLARLLCGGAAPREALAAPRFLLGSTFSDPARSLRIEADVGDGVLAALAARGHDVKALPALSPLCGQAGLIDLRAGVPAGQRAAHDPRA